METKKLGYSDPDVRGLFRLDVQILLYLRRNKLV